MIKEDDLYLFTDGACQRNPGPGGWGALVLDPKGFVTEIGGFLNPSTNNQMEIKAISEGLAFVLKEKAEKRSICVYTDSKYVADGITKWVHGWVKNGWKTSAGKDVLNQDDWKALLENVRALKERNRVSFRHVPAHVGLLLNERADKIASTCAELKKPYLYKKLFKDYPYISGLSNLDEKIRKAAFLKAKIPKKRGQAAYSYVSMIAGVIKTHKTWKECEERVKGASGARFKKALSKEDETSIIGKWT